MCCCSYCPVSFLPVGLLGLRCDETELLLIGVSVWNCIIVRERCELYRSATNRKDYVGPANELASTSTPRNPPKFQNIGQSHEPPSRSAQLT